MAKSIEEQVIVITGASSGIGLVTAKRAAARGARVVLAARNDGDLERAAEEIRQDGGQAQAVATEVTDPQQCEALAARAVEAFGGIDTWVNNAAVSLYATFEDTSIEDFRRLMEVNVFGQVNGAKAALPHLRRSHGALVCIGSVETERGLPYQAAYAASKHALKGWIDALRVELAHDGAGVRVTLIKPASINTPLFDHAKSLIGVRPKPLPPIYAPELVADAILHAAAHDAREVYVGTAGKLLSWTEKLAPRLNDMHQERAGFTSQETDEAVGTDAPNNLYTPLAHDGGEYGRFGAETHRRSLYPWASEHPVLFRTALAGAAAGLVAATLAGRRNGGFLRNRMEA